MEAWTLQGKKSLLVEDISRFTVLCFLSKFCKDTECVDSPDKHERPVTLSVDKTGFDPSRQLSDLLFSRVPLMNKGG